jgi:DNA end-binding protein Ku
MPSLRGEGSVKGRLVQSGSSNPAGGEVYAEAGGPTLPPRRDVIPMPRAIWNGALAFGLVNIPVQVHPAVKDSRPRFRMLHAKDRSPISLERVCRKDGKPVAWQDLVRGYEYQKGRYVVLTREDFAAAAVERSRRIEILDFVDVAAIDDRYFDTPYYLTPGRGGDDAYALLREALRGSGRVGIGKFVFRDVQHLAAVEAIDRALVLSTLRFSDELVEADTLTLPALKAVGRKELQLARTLIESLASDWTPGKYKDDYRANLLRLIKARTKGRTARLKTDTPEHDAKVVDLMERLRRSLDAHPATRPRRPAARKTRARSRRGRAA